MSRFLLMVIIVLFSGAAVAVVKEKLQFNSLLGLAYSEQAMTYKKIHQFLKKGNSPEAEQASLTRIRELGSLAKMSPRKGPVLSLRASANKF